MTDDATRNTKPSVRSSRVRELVFRHSPSQMPKTVLNRMAPENLTDQPLYANCPIPGSPVFREIICKHQMTPASPAKKKFAASGTPDFT